MLTSKHDVTCPNRSTRAIILQHSVDTVSSLIPFKRLEKGRLRHVETNLGNHNVGPPVVLHPRPARIPATPGRRCPTQASPRIDHHTGSGGRCLFLLMVAPTRMCVLADLRTVVSCRFVVWFVGKESNSNTTMLESLQLKTQ